MSIRVIQAYITGSEQDRDVLDASLCVARRFHAHLEVAHVRSDPTDAAVMVADVGHPSFINLLGNLEQAEADWAARTRRHFDEWRAREKLCIVETPQQVQAATVAWRELVGSEARTISEHGPLADLIAVSQPDPERFGRSMATLEAALLDAGRPTLVVPPAAKADPFGPTIVAWNGSVEAARAVSGAIPLLEQSDQVVVFTATGGNRRNAQAQDLAHHLAWRKIPAIAMSFDGPQDDIGGELLRRAAEVRARLIVMGAYTHGRLRQALLGGVTKHVLRHATVPLLMAH